MAMREEAGCMMIKLGIHTSGLGKVKYTAPVPIIVITGYEVRLMVHLVLAGVEEKHTWGRVACGQTAIMEADTQHQRQITMHRAVTVIPALGANHQLGKAGRGYRAGQGLIDRETKPSMRYSPRRVRLVKMVKQLAFGSSETKRSMDLQS